MDDKETGEKFLYENNNFHKEQENISDEEDDEKTLKDIYEILTPDIMFKNRIMYEKMKYYFPWLLDKCDFLTFYKFLLSYNQDLHFVKNLHP